MYDSDHKLLSRSVFIEMVKWASEVSQPLFFNFSLKDLKWTKKTLQLTVGVGNKRIPKVVGRSRG